MARRLFLERRTYRQNRLQDAARLLPFLAAILIFGPIFILDDSAGAPTLATTLVYFFAVWFAMIVLTALVNRALIRSTPAETADGGARPPSASTTAKPTPATDPEAP
ncbi:hypothetical protein A8B78_07495 [Jannaschia sp. EhC01]|nr:hypothetical protein A8B78_07495 [Jannaschia sp. EhC01]